MDSSNLLFCMAGEVIFKEGDPGDRLYILVEGAVELKKKVEGGETVLKTIDQPNDFFGEMTLIDGRPRSATAIAAKASKLMAVDGPTFETMILSNGRFALKIIKVLSDRIRSSNERVGELTESSPRERFLLGMIDYALHVNDRLSDGSFRIDVAGLREWENNRVGLGFDEIDACLFRLVKLGTVNYAKAPPRTNDDLILTAQLIQQHNRRA
jgi:CRP-like cAMP-binding protein